MSVRVAVLGCGRIGRMHAEMLARRVGGAELAGVYDIVTELATEMAARLDVPQAGSVDELYDRGVDAVAICTSTDTHADLIAGAAALGVAVFCEKPISLSLDDVDRALAAVDAAGTLLHVGFNRRFDPSHQAVRDAAARGELGDLHLVRITSRDPAPPPIEYVRRSGGLFCDMTIHDFDMARYVTGSEVVSVFATGAALVDAAIGAAGDIDTAAIVLRHESGCLTTIDNSRRAVYGYDQRVEAFGSSGVAASDNPPVNTTWRRDATGLAGPPIGTFFLERYEQSYLRQWAAFVAAVRDGGPSPVPGGDGRAPLVVALAAAESLATGATVAV
ncbi:inositol 2-dehydrogenase [Desertimonas flava]|uniref:inositol 2-dehydrogenase n=1 Tax=Desertimonas flava TaxID=2064846 RepID=UPI000E3430E0|nr:inositol 2-dehydrogenase [Desertimonas flava]